MYGTASNTDLRQLDSIHNAGVRLALGAICTSPVSSMYTEANEAPLEERRLKLKVGAAVVINRHFQNRETTCRQLSKRLPDNSTIFAAEATAITLALDYYRHMDPVQHVVFYSDSMSCLQAIEGEDTENPLICHIMNLLLALSDKGTCVRFCWVPSHCGIDPRTHAPGVYSVTTQS